MNKLISFPVIIIVMSIVMNSCNSSKASDKNKMIEKTTTNNTNEIEPVTEKKTESASSIVENKTGIKNKALTVVVSNLKSATSPVIISIYGINNKFPEVNAQLKTYKIKPSSKTLTMQIKDIKYGQYAIALYQDVNNNSHIDKNLIGVPTEGYGFSNNIEPTIKAPNFSECKFDYSISANIIKISLIQ